MSRPFRKGDRVAIARLIESPHPDHVSGLTVGLTGIAHHYYDGTGNYSHWLFVKFDHELEHYNRKSIYIPDSMLQNINVEILPDPVAIDPETFVHKTTFESVWKELIG